MIESYSMLLNYLGVEHIHHHKKELAIYTDVFPDGYVVKKAGASAVVLKAKADAQPNQMRILFYPIRYDSLDKAFKSLAKEL